MREGLKQTLKRFIPEPLLMVTRPARFYFHPQRRFDRRFNVDTSGTINPDQLDFEGPNCQDASGYEPTPSTIFARIMSSLPLDFPRFVFVDMGSGKGAVILYASEFPFKRITGVEFSPLLHRIAERNIASYHSKTMKCRDVKSLCMDVTVYPLPPDPTVLFLFNPFKEQVLEIVINNIRRSLEDHPRDVVVIYYHPLSRHSAWDQTEFIQQIRREQDHTIYRSRL